MTQASSVAPSAVLVLKITLINGDLIPPKSGDYINNISPATGEVYSLIPNSEALYRHEFLRGFLH